MVLACDNSRQHKAHERGANTKEVTLRRRLPFSASVLGVVLRALRGALPPAFAFTISELARAREERGAQKQKSSFTSAQPSLSACQGAPHGCRGTPWPAGRRKGEQIEKEHSRANTARDAVSAGKWHRESAAGAEQGREDAERQDRARTQRARDDRFANRVLWPPRTATKSTQTMQVRDPPY